MDYENKTINWKPLSEYNGGRVLATNGLDILIGEINSDGDCADGDGCRLCGITAFADIDDIMPKPKESEDERIRKHAIAILEQYISYFEPRTPNSDTKKHLVNKAKKCIAWIKKQGKEKPANKVEPKFKVTYAGSEYNVLEVKDIAGEIFYGIEDEPNHIDYVKAENCKIIGGYITKENGSPYPTKPAAFSEQNPIDKAEPKFHEGDWVVNRFGEVWHIDSFDSKNYQVSDRKGHYNYFPISKQDEMHLWTIDDAKDGDVLCCESGWTCIFKALNSDISFSSYCFMDNTGWFCETGSESHTLEKAFIKTYNGNIHPATKEQHELLFAMMKEAGYEWDAEKKVLKELGTSYCKEYCKGYKETGGKCYFGFDCPSKREAEQKHQEDDDIELTDFEADLFSAFSDGWQTYLFDKDGLDVAQWAKEHSSELLESAKRTLSEWSEEDTEIPQKQWKPSDEQMRHLASAIEESGGNSVLQELYDQLKKLKEE